MKFKFTILSILLFSLGKGVLAQADPASFSISSTGLAKLIDATPLTSPKNQELLSRAQISGLQKIAYNLYTKKWQEKQQNPYTNLWKGVAADRYFQYLMAPSSHLTDISNIDVNNVYHDASRCLGFAYQKAPADALVNMYYGSFLFWTNASSTKTEAKGLSLLKNAIKIEPNEASAHANLGNAYAASYRNAYNPSLAKRELFEAERLSPTSAFPHWRLVLLDMSIDDYRSADKELSTYVKMISPERASGSMIKMFRAEIQKHIAPKLEN